MDVERVQWIADLMGHTRGQYRERMHAFGGEHAYFLFAFACDIAQNYHGAAALIGYQGNWHDIKIQDLVDGIGDFNFAADQFRPGFFIQAQDTIPFDVLENAANGLPGGGLQRKPKQVRGGAVGVIDKPKAVQHDHAFMQGVKDGLQYPLFLRQPQKLGLQTLGVKLSQPLNQLV